VNGDEFADDGTSGHVPDDHVGIALRQRRIEQGRELADIARQTRIPLRHLVAIEEGNHDALPALPYTIGFVKAYARAVSLDAGAVAERFRAETTKTDRITPSIVHEPIEDARVPTRSAALIGVALLAAVVLAVVAYGAGWFSDDDTADVPVAAAGGEGSDDGQPVAAEPAPPTVAAATPPPTAPAAATPAGTAAAAGQVVITAREDAWVKVYDRSTGQSVFMGVMAAGDRYEVPAERQDLLLWTGRAGALDVSVGGTPIAPLGAPTQTVRDVPLTAAALLARGTQPPGQVQ
jgi:cytoskeletal protein RodZ